MGLTQEQIDGLQEGERVTLAWPETYTLTDRGTVMDTCTTGQDGERAVRIHERRTRYKNWLLWPGDDVLITRGW